MRGTIYAYDNIITRNQRLQLLEQDTRACDECGLHAARRSVPFARGGGLSGVMFIGGFPGPTDDKEGLPFAGALGRSLNGMIEYIGIDLMWDAYITNATKCRPVGRDATPEERQSCQPILKLQIINVRPFVIVTLGEHAAQAVGVDTSQGGWMGRWHKGPQMTPVMPTHHPAYLAHNPDQKKVVARHLEAVTTFLKETHG